MRTLKVATALILCMAGTGAWRVMAEGAPLAPGPDIWLAPTDDVTQHGPDIHALFDHPRSWHVAARHVRGISLPANYLVLTPAPRMTAELARIKAAGLRLNIFIGVLPVDKKLCGAGIEGLAWPGEAASYAARLKRLGADVASFTFDLPLSDAHFLRADQVRHACSLPVADTAQRLAVAVRALRAAYPRADMIDVEVPTGMPTARWIAALSEFLDAFQHAAGEPLRGLIMDAWWKFPWQETVRQTVALLHARGMKAGIYIDESDGRAMPALAWIDAAKRNACALRATGAPLDLLVVASWSNQAVHNVPEDDPSTLTGLADWVAEQGVCPP